MKLNNKLKEKIYRKKTKEEQEKKKKRLQELLIIIPGLLATPKIKTTKKKEQKKKDLETVEIIEVNKKNKEEIIPHEETQLEEKHPEEKSVNLEEKEITNITKNKDDKEKTDPLDILITTLIISATKIDKPKKEKKPEKKVEEKTQEEKEEFEQIASSKIIERYHDKLLDIKHELGEIELEYQKIEEEYETIYKDKDIKELIERLDILIKKIEELQVKIDVPNSYDDKYIFDLVNSYIEDFSNQKTVEDIKSSELYIELYNKIEEINEEKDKLQKEIDEREDLIEDSEKDYDKVKNKLEEFKDDEEQIERFINDAYKEVDKLYALVKNAVTIKERVLIRERQAHLLANLMIMAIATDLAINRNQNPRALAIKVAVGTYLLNHIMNNQFRYREEVRYDVINYTYELQKSINSIDDIKYLLDKSSADIKEIIEKFKNEYQEFIDNNDEFKELMNDLEELCDKLDEKKEEVEKMKKQEEDLLRDNSHKIRTLT